MISFLTTGILLGFSAGFAPGPLLTLVISETLQHDMKAGVKVALAPVITDLPIIMLTVFILGKLSRFDAVLGVISFLGGFLILYLAYESLRTQGVTINPTDFKPKSLLKGIMVNAISPHPYLFWFSVGAPTIVKAMNQSVGASAAFISSFYAFLVGSKILLAVLVGSSKSFLTDKAYIYTMRILGLLLLGFAFFLFYDGLKLFGYV